LLAPAVRRLFVGTLLRALVATMGASVTIGTAMAQTPDLPPFLEKYYAPLFMENGKLMASWGHSSQDGVDTYQYRTAGGSIDLAVQYIPCDRSTCGTFFQNVIFLLNQVPGVLEATFHEINDPNAWMFIRDESDVSNTIVLRMPNAISLFTYSVKVPDYEGTNKDNDFADLYEQAKLFAARQRFGQTVLKGDNVELGDWTASFREYAAALLESGKTDKALAVLHRLVETSPYDLQSHLMLMENAEDAAVTRASAETLYRNAESLDLHEKSARFLNKDMADRDDLPVIEKPEDRLQLLLIPLGPVDLDLLADAAKIYTEITSVPVIVRKLREPWAPGQPDRPFLFYNGQLVNFAGKSEADFLAELRHSMPDDALSRYTLRRLKEELGANAGQYDADRLLPPFLNSIAGYVSDRPRTMVVGVTSENIFSGEARFVFSTYAGVSPTISGSILSYRMLMAFEGQPQSRTRLTERLAKELVPASLKRLGIPRATDPSDPYSYSNGIERVDQKSLRLSAPTATALEAFR